MKKVSHLGLPHMPTIIRKQPQSYSKGILIQYTVSLINHKELICFTNISQQALNIAILQTLLSASLSDTRFIPVQHIMTHL